MFHLREHPVGHADEALRFLDTTSTANLALILIVNSNETQFFSTGPRVPLCKANE